MKDEKTLTTYVNIADIEIVENVRVDTERSDIKPLMQSIHQHGLLEPIGVATTSSGKYLLRFGSRRLMACKKLGHKTILAIITDEPNLEDLLTQNMTENVQRKDISPYELGRQCETLMKRAGLTVGEISVRVQLSESRIKTALLAYGTLPEYFREKVVNSSGGKKRGGTLPPSVMKYACDVKRRFQLKEELWPVFLETARIEELTTPDLQVVAALLAIGFTPEEAIKERRGYLCHRVDVVAKEEELNDRAKKAKCTPCQLLSRIIYGEAKPISKPFFIKSKKAKKR